MAERGFSRDVTTPIAIPQVQAPDFNQNRSTVEDIADVASFGLQVFDRIQSGNAEEKRQKREASAVKLSDDLVVEYTNILEQTGSKTKANIAIQRKISNNPDSAFVNDLTAKRILGLRADFPNASAINKPQPTAFDLATDEEQSQMLAESNLTTVPVVGDPQRATLDTLANERTVNKIALQNAAVAVANADKESAQDLDNLEISFNKVLTTSVRSTIIKATETMEQLSALPIGQQAEGAKELRESMAIMKGAILDSADSVYAGVTTDKGRDRKEATLEQINRTFKNFEDADDAQLANVIKQTEWLTKVKKLELLSSGEVIPVVEALTGGKIMSEAFWAHLIANKEAGDTLLDTVASIYKLSDGQRGALDIQTFANYISGGGTIDDVSDIPLSDEGRAQLFENGFRFYKDITKEGKLNEMDELDKDKASNSIINILNDANSKDPATAEQIMSWVKDPEMTDFLTTIDPVKADAIRNMMITTAKDSARSSNGSLSLVNTARDDLSFNSETGQFEVDTSGPNILPVEKANRRRAKKASQKANRDIDVFLKSREAHPVLKDMPKSEALHWFLLSGAGPIVLDPSIAVKGPALAGPTVDKQAQIEAEQTNKEWQATKDKIAFEASLPVQIATLKEEAKELRSTGKIEDSSDLDNEEFEELIKQMRAERSGK